MPPAQDEREPDYRFSLANERTFLAWIRTALALLAGGMLLHQFASKLQPAWLVGVLAAALAAVSTVLAAGAYGRWRGVQLAMRRDQPLPRSFLLPLLSMAVVGLAATIAVVLVFQ